MNRLQQQLNSYFIFLVSWITSVAYADLPTVVTDTDVPDGDFLSQAQTWGDRAIEVAGLAVSAGAFLIFAYMLVGEAYKQYQSNNPQYGNVVFIGILAGITLISTTFLLTQSAGILVDS